MSLTQTLLSFPPEQQDLSDAEYDSKIRAFRATLTKLAPSSLVSGSVDPDGDGKLLHTLDPAKHSLAYLFVLLAYSRTAQVPGKLHTPSVFRPGELVWTKSLEFLEVFDPIQIRYVGQEYTNLIEIIVTAAQSVSKPILAIHPLKTSILRLDPASCTLTTTHVSFLRLCLHAKAYRSALPVLTKPICHIPAASDKIYLQRAQIYTCDKAQSSLTFITQASGLAGKITSRTYLEYFLYGAMIFMARKEWDDALRFLRIVVAAPAVNTVSKIMVEGYKKWILVSLIANGKCARLPLTTSGIAKAQYGGLARPYEAVASIFTAGTLERLKQEIKVGQKFWQLDNNTGLVLQLVDAHKLFSVLKLEKLFSSISIPEVARQLYAEDNAEPNMEEFIASLIATGKLRARLSQPTDTSAPTILRFSQDDDNGRLDSSAEARLWADLVKQKSNFQLLTENAAAMDLKFELGKDYIEVLRRTQRRNERGSVDSGSKHNQNFGRDFDYDEDLMSST